MNKNKSKDLHKLEWVLKIAARAKKDARASYGPDTKQYENWESYQVAMLCARLLRGKINGTK